MQKTLLLIKKKMQHNTLKLLTKAYTKLNGKTSFVQHFILIIVLKYVKIIFLKNFNHKKCITFQFSYLHFVFNELNFCVGWNFICPKS